jgi:hypothetical protein
MECRDIQISCMTARSLAGPPEACRPQEGLKSKAPKHPEVLGRAILGVQSMLAGLQEHTDLGRSRIQGAQLGWQGRRHTEILQDLGIKARRPQERRFGVQTTNIDASRLAKP